MTYREAGFSMQDLIAKVLTTTNLPALVPWLAGNRSYALDFPFLNLFALSPVAEAMHSIGGLGKRI